VLLGLVEERNDPEDAGAVHNDVDAPKRVDCLVDEFLAGRPVARIRRHQANALAVGRELVLRPVEDLLTPTVQNHRRALFEKPSRRGFADASAAARDQHHLVLKFRHSNSFALTTFAIARVVVAERPLQLQISRVARSAV